MKFFKILCAFLALSITLSAQLASAKDKEYKFNFSGYVTEEIDNQDDLALSKAAEYSLKKGYDFFEVLNVRRYDKSLSARKMNRIGSRTSKRPRLRTEMVIHCYDADPSIESAHNAKQVKQNIEKKYLN